MSKKRAVHNAQLKAKVALAALKGDMTSNQLTSTYGVTAGQISTWKKQLEQSASELFVRGARGPDDPEVIKAPLYEEIGRLKMDLEWLKKNLHCTLTDKRQCIDHGHSQISVAHQCELLGLSRSSLYYRPDPLRKAHADQEDLKIMNMIDRIYTHSPFYGSRRVRVCLEEQLGEAVNRKRVQRLMRLMGIQGVAPGPNTSKPHPEHKIYPYLLRNVKVERPNQVWSTDITYCPLKDGYMYLVAIIDWYSR